MTPETRRFLLHRLSRYQRALVEMLSSVEADDRDSASALLHLRDAIHELHEAAERLAS